MKEHEIYIPSKVNQISLINKISLSGKFQHVLKNDTLIFKSVQKFGNRGVFRLLIPRAEVKATLENQMLKYKVVNDFWAKWMLVVSLGGIYVELLMDRQKFPRDYPPEFIAALFVYFVAMTYYVKARTKRLFEEVVKESISQF